MKIRYKQGPSGPAAVAKIYGPEEHSIDPALIDSDAVSVVSRLFDRGYEAYIVGGAIRDILLGIVPKDFDIATSASPRQVHRIFHNSRIIGRRFKIVHVAFGRKIIEVSTFRSTKDHEEGNDNTFGTIEEDSSRRDFSINSLYYNPMDNTLLDFNNAMEDFKYHRITSLIPLDKTFSEDPVRMLRAVKYNVTTGFRFRFGIAHAIKNNALLLQNVSSSRLTEELNKILASGYSAPIMKNLNKYRLLVFLLPCYSMYIKRPEMLESLKELDEKVLKSKYNPELPEVPKHEQYLALCRPVLNLDPDLTNPSEIRLDLLRQIKVLISPNTPPNYELEGAVKTFMKENNIKLPQPPRKKPLKKQHPVRPSRVPRS